jgi:hypothetical protein
MMLKCCIQTARPSGVTNLDPGNMCRIRIQNLQRSSDPDQDPWLLLVIKETFKITLECQFRLDVYLNMFFVKPPPKFDFGFFLSKLVPGSGSGLFHK